MNKYASGYTAISIITVFGWITICASVIIGLIILLNARNDAGYIGLILGAAGAVQGLLLLGMGSIGLALLDGSASQQRIETILLNFTGQPNFAMKSQEVDSVTDEPTLAARESNLTIYNISEGATLVKEPFFDKNGRIYDTYITTDGKLRVAKGADALEFNSFEEMKEYFWASVAPSDPNADAGVRIQIEAGVGKSISAFIMNDNRIKVSKSGGWQVFESKSEAEEYFQKRK
jgi:hypothetical protein